MITAQKEVFIGYKVVKVVGLAMAACLVCFSLFVLMSKLVENNTSHQIVIDKPFPVELGKVDEDSRVQKIVKKLPKQPEVKPIPKPTVTPSTAATDNPLIGLTGWSMEMSPVQHQTELAGQQQNMSAIPVVRVTPNYPTRAAADGVEGWVQLSFSIDEIGKVIDVSVVDAKPRRIFNREAIKALRKWKYRPKVVDGLAVKQTGQFIVLEFNLEQS